ncbi:MAG: hypothetical protein KGL39_26065 [Patescibacteria group bacterium]|nr:hypothetical protein [Patescibacteria group bacterium]
MDQATIQRYQPGGDIYATLVSQYGQQAAAQIAQAASTGDRTVLGNAIENAKGVAANTGSTSTLVNFWNQITTDPLAAPLQGANSIIGNSFLSLLKNPWVLGTLALVLFTWLGGWSLFRGALKK